MGVAFSTNLIAVYLFLELLTIIPLYFIMAQFGYSDYITRYKVALMCLFWGVAGATLFLIGIVLGYTQIGSFEIADLPQLAGLPQTFWVALLILMGLATKLAIVPLHVWMPWVHAEHPTCIAGLLAIYANIAAYVAVRVLILPLTADMQVFSLPLMVLATITMAYGGFLTLAQTDAKRFCACSTISQISYSVFGIAAMNQLGCSGRHVLFSQPYSGKSHSVFIGRHPGIHGGDPRHAPDGRALAQNALNRDALVFSGPYPFGPAAHQRLRGQVALFQRRFSKGTVGSIRAFTCCGGHTVDLDHADLYFSGWCSNFLRALEIRQRQPCDQRSAFDHDRPPDHPGADSLCVGALSRADLDDVGHGCSIYLIFKPKLFKDGI